MKVERLDATPEERHDRMRFATLLAITLACFCHALWWFNVAPRWSIAVDARRPPAGLRVSYMVEPGESAGDRAVWSPALFALPSVLGFSQPLFEEDVRARPPAGIPAASAHLLPREATPRPERTDATAQPSAGFEIMPPPPHAAATPAFARRVISTNFVLRIEWADGFELRPMQTIPVGEKSPWIDEKSWDASAFVEVDDQGGVRHVFLEKGTTSPERNAAIIRILKGFRIEPTPTSRSGRVVIRYESDVTVADAPPAEGRR